MAKKKPNLVSIPLHDLLKCLISYSELLDTPPPYAETIPDNNVTPIKRSFILDSPKQKLEAIETILFGDEEQRKKRGNKGFEEYDTELVEKMDKEIQETKESKTNLLDKYVAQAKKRFPYSDEESVRVRLDRLHQKLKKEGKFNKITKPAVDFGGKTGFEGIIESDIIILAPFLEKYRKQILSYYLDKPKEDINIESLPSWLQETYKNTPE